MARTLKKIRTIKTVTEMQRMMGISNIPHPLVAVVKYEDIRVDVGELTEGIILDFYKVSLKCNFKGKMRYGQGHYNLDSNGLSFMAPNQLIQTQAADQKYSGYSLLIHPDFLRSYPLAKKIKKYEFFSYAVNEPLHLSKNEEDMIVGIVEGIDRELTLMKDEFTADVVISQIELLLNYCNRFYKRQYVIHKGGNSALLIRFEDLLNEYFEGPQVAKSGLPSVKYLSQKLNVTPNYLSESLRSTTGQNTQEHIHNKVLEKGKELLSSTELAISEIAYKLGFEHPQSFAKFFKQKMESSPSAYRDSFR